MIEAMKEYAGKALTVTGPVAPEALGQVMMHEHLHCDLHDPDTDRLVVAETPTPPEREKTGGSVPVPTSRRRPFCTCSPTPCRHCASWG